MLHSFFLPPLCFCSRTSERKNTTLSTPRTTPRTRNSSSWSPAWGQIWDKQMTHIFSPLLWGSAAVSTSAQFQHPRRNCTKPSSEYLQRKQLGARSCHVSRYQIKIEKQPLPYMFKLCSRLQLISSPWLLWHYGPVRFFLMTSFHGVYYNTWVVANVKRRGFQTSTLIMSFFYKKRDVVNLVLTHASNLNVCEL